MLEMGRPLGEVDLERTVDVGGRGWSCSRTSCLGAVCLQIRPVYGRGTMEYGAVLGVKYRVQARRALGL